MTMTIAIKSVEEIPNQLSILFNHQSPTTIGVSGGSLPSLLGSKLSHLSTVHVFLCDERLVSLDSEDSNYRSVKEHLSKALPKAIYYPLNTNLISDPLAAAQDYARQIGSVVKSEDGIPVFDLLFLGMGPDGISIYSSTL